MSIKWTKADVIAKVQGALQAVQPTGESSPEQLRIADLVEQAKAQRGEVVL